MNKANKKHVQLELTKKCAKWLGLVLKTMPMSGDQCYQDDSQLWITFDPLNNWQQFMEMVLPKLPKRLWIYLDHSGFCINDQICPVNESKVSGHYPTDLRRAVLERISKMGVKDGQN